MSVPYVIECSVLELTMSEVSILIMSIYSIDRDVKLFFCVHENSSKSLPSNNLKICVAGDFNTDIRGNDEEAEHFLVLLISYNSQPTILDYSSVTDESKSFIDNIQV